MKLLKKLLYVLLLIVLVALIAIAALIFFVDPNKLKPLIAQEVTKTTGYQAVIEGNLSWSFYPRLGIKMQHMTLNEPGQPIFADLTGLLIATDFAQLFEGQQTLQGNVYIAAVKLANVQFTKVHTGLTWNKGVLTLKPITAALYQGTLAGEVRGSQLAAIPRWQWNIELKDIQLKYLLLDMSKEDSKLNVTGLARVNMQASAQGKSKDQMLNSLNGTLQFSLNDGVVEGVDLNYLIQMAEAIITKQPFPIPNNINQTKFDSLTGSAVIKNGIATTNNLLLLAPAFVTKGEGQINLPVQTIDYRSQASLTQPGKTQWIIPVSIEGSLKNPSVKLDVGTLNTLMTKEQLEKVKNKVQEEIKKLPEKADKFLKKLMGE